VPETNEDDENESFEIEDVQECFDIWKMVK
jgi:hypothetical protein